MRLRLTRPAARQLDRALSYVYRNNPRGARNVQQCLQDVMQLLLQHPFAGRATGRPGIRRIVASPYPYVLTYRVGDGEIVIRSVRHTSRRPIARPCPSSLLPTASDLDVSSVPLGRSGRDTT